jgi:hypothetical protein
MWHASKYVGSGAGVMCELAKGGTGGDLRLWDSLLTRLLKVQVTD